MPTAPRYNVPQLEPQIGPAAMQDPTPAPRFDYAAAGKAVGSVVETVGGIAQRQDQLAVEQAALEADSQLGNIQKNLLTDGMAKYKGADAVKAPDEIMAEYEKQTSELASKLGGSILQTKVAARIADRGETLRGTLERHAAQESEEYRKASYKNVLEGNQSVAALAARTGDFRAVVRLYDETDAAVKDELRTSGFKPTNPDGTPNPAYQQMVREEHSGLNRSAILGALSSNNLPMAQMIFDKAKADQDINEQDLAKVEDAFKQADRNTKENAYIAARNIAEANPGLPPQKAIPKAMWEGLEPGDRDALIRFHKNQGDPHAYLDFLEVKPVDLAKMNRHEFETKYWSRMEPSDQDKAASAWKEAKDSNGKKTKTLDDWRTKTDIVRKVYQSDGKDYNPPDGATSELNDVKVFETIVGREQKARQEALERELTNDEFEKVVSDVKTRMVFVDRSSWIPGATEKNIVELTPEDIQDVVVPDDVKGYLEAQMATKGVEVDPARVRRAFVAYKTGDREDYEAAIGGR